MQVYVMVGSHSQIVFLGIKESGNRKFKVIYDEQEIEF